MAFLDTSNRDKAMIKAVKQGATHYSIYIVDCCHFSYHFFKGNQPLSLEECQEILPTLQGIKEGQKQLHEVGYWSVDMKSFNVVDRLNSLNTEDVKEIDPYFFTQAKILKDFTK